MCMMDSASYSPPSSSSQAEDSLETSLPSVTKIEDKLKSLNLQGQETKWLDNLINLSQKSGFTVTRVEERCEGKTEVQTLLQCSTDPVLVSCAVSEESESERAGNLAAQSVLHYIKYHF